MNVLAEPFWVQKRGNQAQEYEDAAFPVDRRDYAQHNVRLAVADGATECLFARRWAEQLVHAVGEGVLSLHGFFNGITRLRADWQQWIIRKKTLPWYAEEKARQGAFAALLALELTTEGSDGAMDGCWNAAAVGDSCLFHIRGENVLVRFPLTTPEAFDNRPILLGSVGTENSCLNELTSSGLWKKGDAFFLMTDALACWFIKHLDAGGSPLEVQGDFAFPNDPDPFRAWVESLRDKGSIRNDDCTLIRVHLR